jgi:glycosyltransferase involved in cell wall biosynthesis
MQAADVVHIHAMWEAIEHEAAALARELGKPAVWTPHGMLDEWNMTNRRWFKRACLFWRLRRDLNGMAAIHAASDFERDNIARLGLAAPVIVEGFGLDDCVLSANPQRGAFRAQHAIGDATPMVLFLGRIQSGKGLELLVPAMARLTSAEALLVIAGPDEGGYRQTIERLIAAQGVGGRVKFVGMLGMEEKLQALRDADVVAAPSSHENFGIAVAEAIAIGTPVVVSDQVGLARFVQQHGLGRVVTLDIAAVAEAIDALLASRPSRDPATAAAIRQRFDWRHVAGRWRQIYEEVTGQLP